LWLTRLKTLAKHFIEYSPNSHHDLKWYFMWLAKLDTIAKSFFWEKFDSPCQILMSSDRVWQALCKWPLLTGGAGIKNRNESYKFNSIITFPEKYFF
jgi:hypothetical protein